MRHQAWILILLASCSSPAAESDASRAEPPPANVAAADAAAAHTAPAVEAQPGAAAARTAPGDADADTAVPVAQAALEAQDAASVTLPTSGRVEPDGFVYFVSHLSQLEFVVWPARDDGVPTGELADVTPPETGVYADAAWARTARIANQAQHTQRVVIEGPGEWAVARSGNGSGDSTHWPTSARVALRLAEPRDVRGRVFVPNPDWSGHMALDFVVPAEAFSAEDRREWLRVLADSADEHLTVGHTGAAWYRHQRDEALQALAAAAPDGAGDTTRRRAGGSELMDSFSLFSGGRAVSENLALDRLLPLAAEGEAGVPVDTIPGVTVVAYDWSGLIEGLDPAPDPLAALLPADQHALLFPSFEALLSVTDELDGLGAPLARLSEEHAESADTRARYERQLGLPMSELARLLGPHLIRSVAVTGGDAYLRTGSDVAVLFEPREASATLAAISARVQLALAGQPGVERVDGEVEGLAYTSLRNADRSVCSYVAALDGAVVVTNSPAQLARLARVADGRDPALDSLPEYTFFRDRYRLGDPEEGALLILSDATIRRWCGPRLRIGAARRARAAAVLSEVAARQVDGRSGGDGDPLADAVSLPSLAELPDAGALTLDGARVRSDVYGTLAFATPLSELDLELVTEEEEALYSRWRDGYERGWRRAFDPIAVRLGVGGQRISADVSVRPLMVDSDYERFLETTRGGAIESHAGDLHPGTLIHYAFAVDGRQLGLQRETSLLKVVAPNVDMFGWLGGSVSLRLEDTSFWDRTLDERSLERNGIEELVELPLVLQAEVGDGLQLAAALTVVRALVESSAPGMVSWENREHEGVTYVRVAETASGGISSGLSLYYTTGPEQLTLSLSEEVIQRAIERRLARAVARAEGVASAAEREAPWLGEHMGARITLPAVSERWGRWAGVDLQGMVQLASWSNLPILNEWRRRFPGEDPVRVHEGWFARRPLCPGGGEYRWNAAWQTMESSVYGHPGAPRDGPSLTALLSGLSELHLGTTFEDDGLRARVELLLSDARAAADDAAADDEANDAGHEAPDDDGRSR